MYSEVAWVMVSSGTQVQPQTTLEPSYPADFRFFSFEYVIYIAVLKKHVQLIRKFHWSSFATLLEIFQ